MPSLFATEPLSIGGVLDQTFRLAKASLKAIVPFALAQGGLTVVMQVIQLWPVLAAGGARPAATGLAPGPAWLLLFPLSLAAMVCSLAALYRCYEIGAAIAPPSSAWERGRRRLWPVFRASILFMLPVVAFGIVAAILIPSVQDGKIGAGTAVVLGLIGLAVVLQWFSRAFLYLPESLIVSVAGAPAIRASLRLTRGRVLRLSGVLLVGLLVIVGIYFLSALVAGVVGALLARTLALPTVMFTAVVQVLVTFLVTIPVTAYSSSLTLSLWHDLKLRAEGTDLGAQIDALNRDA